MEIRNWQLQGDKRAVPRSLQYGGPRSFVRFFVRYVHIIKHMRSLCP